MASTDFQRKLTAILCADVVGYSRLKRWPDLFRFSSVKKAPTIPAMCYRSTAGSLSAANGRRGIGSTCPRTFPGVLEVSDGF